MVAGKTQSDTVKTRNLLMCKQVKYGDFFLDPTKKRRIRKMRTEVREKLIENYSKRAAKQLPIFEENK